MAELVDARDLKSLDHWSCRFDSGWVHQVSMRVSGTSFITENKTSRIVTRPTFRIFKCSVQSPSPSLHTIFALALAQDRRAPTRDTPVPHNQKPISQQDILFCGGTYTVMEKILF